MSVFHHIITIGVQLVKAIQTEKITKMKRDYLQHNRPRDLGISSDPNVILHRMFLVPTVIKADHLTRMIVVRIGLILDMIDAMEEKIIDLITTVMIPIIEMIVIMKIIVHHQLEQGILL
jgi:hypothetical protein